MLLAPLNALYFGWILIMGECSWVSSYEEEKKQLDCFVEFVPVKGITLSFTLFCTVYTHISISYWFDAKWIVCPARVCSACLFLKSYSFIYFDILHKRMRIFVEFKVISSRFFFLTHDGNRCEHTVEMPIRVFTLLKKINKRIWRWLCFEIKWENLTKKTSDFS